MRINSRYICYFLMATVISFSLVFEAHGQKKKNKKKGKIEVETPDIEDYRLAEYFLTEAEKYFILEDYAKAFVLYQKSLEYDPDNASAHYKISQIFVAGNELNKALGYAKKALEISPENKYFYLQLAEIYTKQSNFESASDVYEQMLANTEDSDEYMFELAALYIYQDRIEDALAMYDRIEERFGLNEQVIAQKQKLYIQQSDLESAIEEGQKLIDTYPYEPDHVLSLTEILLSNGLAERAGTIIEESLKYNPGDARLQFQMSRVYRKLGEHEKANQMLKASFGSPDLDLNTKLQIILTYINKLPDEGEDIKNITFQLADQILETHPNEPDAHAAYGDIYMQLEKDSLAAKYYVKAIELGSTNYNIFQNLIQIEARNEQYKKIIEHAEMALEYYPNQPVFYFYLGMAYHVEKQYEDAIATLENGKMLASDNKQLQTYFNAQLGDAYNEVEAYDKSDESYEAALAADPNNDHVLNNYAYFLSLRKEKLDMAKKMSAKLVQAHPENATYLDTHAWVLYQMGDYQNARVYIEKAIEVGEELSGTILEHYGDILFKLGEVDSAVKQWQKAKGLDETSELIDRKIADRKLYE
jgi:tetratricopeptide (TPR) repeat protein